MKKRTSKELIAETLREIAAVKPLDKITVKEIIKESGVAVQTFYNNFSDKMDVVRWLVLNQNQRVFDAFMSGEYDYRDLTMDNVNFLRENYKLLLMTFDYRNGVSYFTQDLVINGSLQVEKYILEKYYMDQIPEEISLLLRMYNSLIISSLPLWIKDFPDISNEKMTDLIIESMPERLKEYLLK